MKKYEFVVVIHPTLAQEDVQATLSTIESIIWSATIVEKDDIWYQTVYNIRWLKNHNQAYFVSYLIEVDEQEIIWYNKKLSLVKWLLRYIFLSKKPNDPFHKFSEINSKYLEKIEELDKKKVDEKKNNKKNNKKQLENTEEKEEDEKDKSETD